MLKVTDNQRYVRQMGLEPIPGCPDHPLKVARLPFRHCRIKSIRIRVGFEPTVIDFAPMQATHLNRVLPYESSNSHHLILQD